MVKRLTAVFVLSLFVVFVFSGGAFAAAKKSSDVKWTRHISQDWNVDGSGYESFNVPQRAYSKYLTGGAKLTCTDIQPEVGIIIQHDEIGDTWYDFQKNGAMGRMISVTSGGYRHISWMYTDHEYPPGMPTVRIPVALMSARCMQMVATLMLDTATRPICMMEPRWLSLTVPLAHLPGGPR
jgi:hypothetical protein